MGLYDEVDPKDLTTGDLYDRDYWDADFNAKMLEIALKTRQGEGAIQVKIEESIRTLDPLIAKYPAHAGLKAWKARGEAILKKISPDANRGESFSGECPWNQVNLEQLWFNFFFGKMAFERKDYNQAQICLSNVVQNYQFILRPERFNQYPEDLQKLLNDSKPMAEEMYKTSKAKLGFGS